MTARPTRGARADAAGACGDSTKANRKLFAQSAQPNGKVDLRLTRRVGSDERDQLPAHRVEFLGT